MGAPKRCFVCGCPQALFLPSAMRFCLWVSPIAIRPQALPRAQSAARILSALHTTAGQGHAVSLQKNACNDFVGLSRRCHADESYIDSLKRSWLKSKTNLKTNFHQLRSLLRRRRATIGIAFSAKTLLLPKITVPELNSYNSAQLDISLETLLRRRSSFPCLRR